MDSRIMHQLTYGLFVLSAAENRRDNGCIINTATQVSASPVRVTISVCKQNYTHDMIMRSGRVLQAWELGSHSLFLADIETGRILSDREPVSYAYYYKNIKPKPQSQPRQKGWRCKICGYVYEGEELPPDFVCPLCRHGTDDFERIE